MEVLPKDSRPNIATVVATLLCVVVMVVLTTHQAENSSRANVLEIPLVYSSQPNDSWNRIFTYLFTRRVKAHLTAEADPKASSTRLRYPQFPHDLYVSTNLVDRLELGDRAIEPLYPSFITSVGVSQVLAEPLYSQLVQALTDALKENDIRPPLARALMQSDAWAAYDLLYLNSYRGPTQNQKLVERRDYLLTLLGRFIDRLMLTRSEIETLADNYAATNQSHVLPELFDPGSGWWEVRWLNNREHDLAADYRRVTRVFIKPASSLRNKQEFLNSLRNDPQIVSKLEAVALVTQNLLIENDGKLVPSQLTYDVQIRRFLKNERRDLMRTDLEEFELSRQLLLSQPLSGGLVRFDETAKAYLPASGNDYTFASLQLGPSERESSILGTLRSRCVSCHGSKVDVIFTFSTNQRVPYPAVSQLDVRRNEHAVDVVQKKMQREDFKSLLTFLNKSN